MTCAHWLVDLFICDNRSLSIALMKIYSVFWSIENEYEDRFKLKVRKVIKVKKNYSRWILYNIVKCIKYYIILVYDKFF